MNPPVFRTKLYGFASLFAFGACVPASEPTPQTQAGDIAPLLNAQRSFDRPEVGQIQLGNSSCTATLIDPQTIITAAHCMDYQSAAPNQRRGSFTVELSADDRRSYVVQGWQPLSTNRFSSELDVGMVRLMTPVPATVATPAPLSSQGAQSGESITLYGYGCTSRNGGGAAFAKRVMTGAYGFTKNLCSGDSGGPVFLGRDGSLAYVNSGYIVGPGNDLFGEVVPQRSSIRSVTSQWDGTYGRALPTAVEVKNETGARLVVRCDAPAEIGECDDWQFLEVDQRQVINTYGGFLSLYNVGLGASVTFQHHKVTARSPAVAVRPSLSTSLVAIPATGGGGSGPDGGSGSDAGSGADAGMPQPDAGTQQPDAGTQQPDAGTQQPDAGTQQPDAGAGMPDAGSTNPGPVCLGGSSRTQSDLLSASGAGLVCADRSSWFSFTMQRFEFIEFRLNFAHSLGDIDAKLVTADGRLLAFSADRSDEEILRYVATEAAEVFLRVYGFDSAETDVQFSLYRDANLSDADGDSVPDSLDLCRNTPQGAGTWLSGRYIGCAGGQYMDRPGPQDADGDGVQDYEDRCSGTALGASIWLKAEYLGCAGGQTLDR